MPVRAAAEPMPACRRENRVPSVRRAWKPAFPWPTRPAVPGCRRASSRPGRPTNTSATAATPARPSASAANGELLGLEMEDTVARYRHARRPHPGRAQQQGRPLQPAFQCRAAGRRRGDRPAAEPRHGRGRAGETARPAHQRTGGAEHAEPAGRPRHRHEPGRAAPQPPVARHALCRAAAQGLRQLLSRLREPGGHPHRRLCRPRRSDPGPGHAGGRCLEPQAGRADLSGQPGRRGHGGQSEAARDLWHRLVAQSAAAGDQGRLHAGCRAGRRGLVHDPLRQRGQSAHRQRADRRQPDDAAGVRARQCPVQPARPASPRSPTRASRWSCVACSASRCRPARAASSASAASCGRSSTKRPCAPCRERPPWRSVLRGVP